MSEHMIDSTVVRHPRRAVAERVAALFSGMATGLAIAAPATLIIGPGVVLTELRLAAIAWLVAAGARLLAPKRASAPARRRRRPPARVAQPMRAAAHVAQPRRAPARVAQPMRAAA